MDPGQEPTLKDKKELKRRPAKTGLKAQPGNSDLSMGDRSKVNRDGASPLGEEPFRSLFLNMTEGCALHEIVCDEAGKPCDYRFIEINPAFERLTGLRRDETIGRLATEVLPDLEPFWIEIYGQVALTGHPVQFDQFTRAINRYYRVYAYSPAPLTFAAIFMDITDQKQVELQLNEVAEKYFTLFNSTSDGVLIHDLEGRILEVNDAYCHMSGFSRDEVIHMPVSMLEAVETPAEVNTHIQKIISQEGHDRYESIHRCKNGDVFDVDVTALYFDLEGGRIAIFVRDITTRKQVEKRVAYLASFPDRNPNPITEVDMQGKIHYINAKATQLFPDLPRKGTAHAWFADWETDILPFRQDRHEMIIRDVKVGDQWFQQSLSYILPDGLVRIYGTDITQRKQGEEAIRLSEEKYRTIVETSAEGIALISLDGIFTYVNQRMADMLGYPMDEIVGRSSVDFMFEDMQTQLKLLRNQLHRGDILNGEFRFRRKDGSVLYTIYNSSPIFNDQGEHIANIAMHMDITERKQADEALRASERRLSRAEEIAHLGSWELDLATNRLTWSDEVYRLFGYQPQEFPATYQAFLDAIHPDDRNAVDKAYTDSIRDGRDSYEIEHRLIDHSTGEVRIVHEKCIHFRDESGNVIRSEGMVHDITERKMIDQALRRVRDELELRVQERTQALIVINDKLMNEVAQRKEVQGELEANVQELQATEAELQNALTKVLEMQDQLIQSEKFAAVGRLLASITHEINNPLQTIKNCLYLSQEDTLADSPVAEYLKMASAETDRLSNLVAQLREVYRPPTQRQKKLVNLPTVVREVQTLLAGYLLEKHIAWVMEPPEASMLDCMTIEAVPDQLKQVFLNIALNAIDAMEPLGGSINISFRISDDHSEVGVVFCDNGPGVPEEVVDKLFEPFITTKEKGLGLGLVICYDIIKKHNGSIELETKPGEGATFTIWLPTEVPAQAATTVDGS